MVGTLVQVARLGGAVATTELNGQPGVMVDPFKLVQDSLDRIDELNPQLNAFIDVYADDALAEADAIGTGDERPFAGVPIAIRNKK